MEDVLLQRVEWASWRCGEWYVARFNKMILWGISNGLVTGQMQTVVRAEITAVISACKFVGIHQKQFWLFIDNELVWKRVKRFLRDTTVGQRQKDSDLWSDLAFWFAKVKHLCHEVVKVHESPKHRPGKGRG